MFFRNRYDNRTYQNFQVCIDNLPISKVSTTKFLGLTLDDSLTWIHHSAYVTNIVSKYSGILFRLKHFLTSNTLFSLYNSLVLPHLQYCSIIWADKNNCNLHRIHLKQKQIIRLCTNAPFLAHTPPLFAKFKTLTIYDIHKLQIALFMYKYNNNHLPDIFANYFIKCNAIHEYGTRSSDLYRPFNFKNNLARNTIRRQGPILWNNINLDIRISVSVNNYKNKYKYYLLSNYQ